MQLDAWNVCPALRSPDQRLFRCECFLQLLHAHTEVGEPFMQSSPLRVHLRAVTNRYGLRWGVEMRRWGEKHKLASKREGGRGDRWG